MKKQSNLKKQLLEIKSKVIYTLNYELLFDVEVEVLECLYELINKILLDKVDDKRYSVEEIVDMRIMEFIIVLETSDNKKVKEIVRILKKGLNW